VFGAQVGDVATAARTPFAAAGMEQVPINKSYT
jgi:hypothetical protein